MMPSPRQPRATGGEPAPGVALLPKARVLPDGFCARIETESSAERYPSDLPENHGLRRAGGPSRTVASAA
jgi:hypothetical protein